MTTSLLFLLLIAMTVFGSFGGALFKRYSASKRFVLLAVGGACYGTGALLNIYLLTKLPYTLVLPANSLTFVWTLLLAKWWFGEKIGKFKIAGTCIIMCGLLLLVL
ncbi:EamA family transporter [Paenibacillus methanolicus]|uniref:Undecaprenyl phosphate-alpha-L-ara4N flippase subunit ArnE n=1 Tax=Paenibacillus methanolicus TaxID=582686 RepID=A0A5S5BZ51_9BACL|nr:EamA family transporter [Paenibacillus methanolicus]TYP72465.1 undecaprenyl phosphate-alpha-L-ara4N flippase subunit ArnE [Paenibacillus methanolicus]